jgi:hypothetical protein
LKETSRLKSGLIHAMRGGWEQLPLLTRETRPGLQGSYGGFGGEEGEGGCPD